MNKVFGIGWAKTGTKTLGKCLSILGYRNRSQDQRALHLFLENNIGEILELARSYDSFEDWPWLLLYERLDRAYPNSRFILTTRSSSAWIRSYRSMLAREGEASKFKIELRRRLYNLPFPDVTDESLCRRVSQHIADVKDFFSGWNDLLIVSWVKGDSWQTLCEFLGRPLPTVSFPHENRAPEKP